MYPHRDQQEPGCQEEPVAGRHARGDGGHRRGEQHPAEPADARRPPRGRVATGRPGGAGTGRRRCGAGSPAGPAPGEVDAHPVPRRSAYAGVYGIARSYEEAREALTTAGRLRLDTPVVHARDLLVFRVLLRDQLAIADLVQTVLSPLGRARGGAQPLVDTLQAYFESGAVATEAASRLHVAVRTVTYRLARIKALTGYDPGDPAHRFTLEAAVLGARALDWPAEHRPGPG